MTKSKLAVDGLTAVERLERAQEKMPLLVDRAVELIEIHAQNEMVFYSHNLRKQNLSDHARKALKVLESSSFMFEVIRLTAFWETPHDQDLSMISIPAVHSLLNSDDVLMEIHKQVLNVWSVGRSEEEAQVETKKRMNRLRKARNFLTKHHKDTAKMLQVQNFRHKYLAHSLEETRLEQFAGAIDNPKRRHIRFLYRSGIIVTDAFYQAVNNTGFAWAGSFDMARRDSTALWLNAKFAG